MATFRLCPKIIYIDGWVYIPDFERYHTNHSEKTQKGIENAWKSVAERIRLKLKELAAEEYTIEGVSASSCSSSSSPTEVAVVSKPKKEKFGELQHVSLSSDEYQKLCSALSEPIVQGLIVELDQYIASTGKRYASHCATIQSWVGEKLTSTRPRTLGRLTS